jgi:hypothetical protein
MFVSKSRGSGRCYPTLKERACDEIQRVLDIAIPGAVLH